MVARAVAGSAPAAQPDAHAAVLGMYDVRA
jgi:hypothetical protein